MTKFLAGLCFGLVFGAGAALSYQALPQYKSYDLSEARYKSCDPSESFRQFERGLIAAQILVLQKNLHTDVESVQHSITRQGFTSAELFVSKEELSSLGLVADDIVR